MVETILLFLLLCLLFILCFIVPRVCPHCGSLHIFSLAQHVKQCDHRPIMCSLGCEQFFKAKDLEQHEQECEHRIVTCSLCAGTFKAMDLDHHRCSCALKVILKFALLVAVLYVTGTYWIALLLLIVLAAYICLSAESDNEPSPNCPEPLSSLAANDAPTPPRRELNHNVNDTFANCTPTSGVWDALAELIAASAEFMKETFQHLITDCSVWAADACSSRGADAFSRFAASAAMHVSSCQHGIPLSYEDVKHIRYRPKSTFEQKFRMAGRRRIPGQPAMRPREDPSIKALYEKVPRQCRTTERGICKFLHAKDASHILPHSEGGTSDASNILWEDQSLNRSRGARVMTSEEIQGIERGNARAASEAGVDNIRRAAADGLKSGAAYGMLFASLDEGSEVLRNMQKGEDVSIPDYCAAVAYGTAQGAACGAVSAGAATAIVQAAPVVAPIMGVVAVGVGAGMAAKGVESVDRFCSSIVGPTECPGILTSTTEYRGLFTTDTEARGWFSTTRTRHGLFGSSTTHTNIFGGVTKESRWFWE